MSQPVPESTVSGMVPEDFFKGTSPYSPADRSRLLSPLTLIRAFPVGDRKVTQPPLLTCFGKGRFSFLPRFLTFLFSLSSTLSDSVLGLFPTSLWGLGQQCVASLFQPRLMEGLAGWGGLWPYCVQWEQGGPLEAPAAPYYIGSITLKHIAHPLHNKPQLFHGSN